MVRVIPSVAPLVDNQGTSPLFPHDPKCLWQLGKYRSMPGLKNNVAARGLDVGWGRGVGTSLISFSNPALQLIQTGKGEAIRIRSILRSLVPTEDLVGIISIPLKLPSLSKGKRSRWRLSPARLPGARSLWGRTVCRSSSWPVLPGSYLQGRQHWGRSCSPPGSSWLLSPLLPCV